MVSCLISLECSKIMEGSVPACVSVYGSGYGCVVRSLCYCEMRLRVFLMVSQF